MNEFWQVERLQSAKGLEKAVEYDRNRRMSGKRVSQQLMVGWKFHFFNRDMPNVTQFSSVNERVYTSKQVISRCYSKKLAGKLLVLFCMAYEVGPTDSFV